MALPNTILLQGTAGAQPAASTVVAGTLYFQTDGLLTQQSDGTSWTPYSGTGGTGTVTASGTLTANQLIIGAGTTVIASLGSAGTSTTLLHGGAPPTYGAVSLSADVTGTLGVTHGGTGLATATQGDLLYGSAANTYSALAKDTNATRYLSNTGTTNNPAWAQVALTTGVSGILPVANGGTGLADAAVLRVATQTINNAAILTLPTASVAMVAAPSAGFIVVPVQGIVRTNFGAGAYTGIAAASWMAFHWSNSSTPAAALTGYPLTFIPNDTAIVNPSIGTTALTDFMAANSAIQAIFLPNQNADDEAGDQWGLVPAFNNSNTNVADMSATGVRIEINNNGVNLGGGNAGNTLTVKLYYFLEAV